MKLQLHDARRLLVPLAGVLGVLVGCKATRELDVPPGGLSRGVTVLVPEPPLRALGPTIELCLDLPPNYEFDLSEIRVRPPGGSWSTAHAVLISRDGSRKELKPASLLIGKSTSLCFLDTVSQELTKDGEQEYERVELLVDAPLEIEKVRWWSGKRRYL